MSTGPLPGPNLAYSTSALEPTINYLIMPWYQLMDLSLECSERTLHCAFHSLRSAPFCAHACHICEHNLSISFGLSFLLWTSVCHVPQNAYIALREHYHSWGGRAVKKGEGFSVDFKVALLTKPIMKKSQHMQ